MQSADAGLLKRLSTDLPDTHAFAHGELVRKDVASPKPAHPDFKHWGTPWTLLPQKGMRARFFLLHRQPTSLELGDKQYAFRSIIRHTGLGLKVCLWALPATLPVFLCEFLAAFQVVLATRTRGPALIAKQKRFFISVSTRKGGGGSRSSQLPTIQDKTPPTKKRVCSSEAEP